MMSKFAFEAVNCALRDISNRWNAPFRVITFMMQNDFRQVLSVVSEGLRPDVVVASIEKFYLCTHVHV